MGNPPPPKDAAASEPRHLTVVKGSFVPPADSAERLERFVRTARRDMGRLLRALHASGRSLSGWPHELATRIAHVDVVTARFIIDSESVDAQEVEEAAQTMRLLEKWLLGRLSVRELAEVRAFELTIRIDDEQLREPLVRLDFAGDDDESVDLDGPPALTLRHGLRHLASSDLEEVCHRLGVRPLSGRTPPEAKRRRQEAAVIRLLRDEHLLGILVATLNVEAQHLLASLVRHELDVGTLRQLAVQHGVAMAAGDALVCAPVWQTPAHQLRACGLVYCGGMPARLWVPAELQCRLDGILRALGL